MPDTDCLLLDGQIQTCETGTPLGGREIKQARRQQFVEQNYRHGSCKRIFRCVCKVLTCGLSAPMSAAIVCAAQYSPKPSIAEAVITLHDTRVMVLHLKGVKCLQTFPTLRRSGIIETPPLWSHVSARQRYFASCTACTPLQQCLVLRPVMVSYWRL